MAGRVPAAGRQVNRRARERNSERTPKNVRSWKTICEERFRAVPEDRIRGGWQEQKPENGEIVRHFNGGAPDAENQ